MLPEMGWLLVRSLFLPSINARCTARIRRCFMSVAVVAAYGVWLTPWIWAAGLITTQSCFGIPTTRYWPTKQRIISVVTTTVLQRQAARLVHTMAMAGFSTGTVSLIMVAILAQSCPMQAIAGRTTVIQISPIPALLAPWRWAWILTNPVQHMMP